MSKRPALPLGDDFTMTVDRLKDLAGASYEALLVAGGPPHPDYHLLDLCADALHNLTHANRLQTERLNMPYPNAAAAQALYRQVQQDLYQHQKTFAAAASQQIRAAGKLRATTPAGIYAKALVVRASSAGAAKLGVSLAEELIDCQELRGLLWPARAEEAAAV